MTTLTERLKGMLKNMSGSEASLTLPNVASNVAFVPHNHLETALVAAAEDSTQQANFNEILLGSDLWVVVLVDIKTSTDLTLSTTQAAIATVRSKQDEVLPALFSSAERAMEVFGPKAQVKESAARDVLRGVATKGGVLNPGLGYGIYWDVSALAALLGIPVARTVAADSKPLLSLPPEPPPKLVARIVSILELDIRVEEAWLAFAQWSDKSEKAWFLDLRSADPGDDLARTLGEAVHDIPMQGLPLDIVVNKLGEPAGIGLKVKPHCSE